MLATETVDSIPGAEQSLWAEVLRQQLRDLADANGHCRMMAEAWVGGRPSRHFEMVCALAGIEASAAHRFMRAVAEAPVEVRRKLLGGIGELRQKRGARGGA